MLDKNVGRATAGPSGLFDTWVGPTGPVNVGLLLLSKPGGQDRNSLSSHSLTQMSILAGGTSGPNLHRTSGEKAHTPQCATLLAE